MIPSWVQGAWDVCDIDEVRMPGHCRVTISKGDDVQETPTPGEDAPVLKNQGSRAAVVTIENEVWSKAGGADRRDIEEAARRCAELYPRQPGAIKKPHSITCPAATILAVKAVTIVNVSIGPINGGRLVIKYDCKEYFPESAAKPATQGAQAPGGGAPPGDGGPLDDGTVPPADPENLGMDTP